jgi:16S rRNA G966 N2-methylase RsmD
VFPVVVAKGWQNVERFSGGGALGLERLCRACAR